MLRMNMNTIFVRLRPRTWKGARLWSRVLGGLVLSGGLRILCGQALAATPAQPGIVIFLADDLGWSDLGCYGGEIKTPNIDRLAKNGVRFTQFYNTARCCPTRASLLTGLYPHQAGVGAMSNDRGPQFPGYRGTLQSNSVTLAEVLREAGYRTCMVGKWHLHNQQDVKPTDRGFDEFYGMLGGYNTCWEEKPYYTRWPLDRTPRPYTSAKDGQPGTFYSTDAFADYALDFAAQARAQHKPLFLYFAFNAPHFPLGAPESAIAKYEAMYFAKGWDVIREERLARQKELGLVPQDLALPPRSLVPPKSHARPSPYAGRENPPWSSFSEERRRDLARRMAVYAAMVDRIDAAVGRVVTDLQQHGQLDNTLILFLSDNGACWEWDPLGFDIRSGPTNILHTGEDLKKVGGPDSYISYGSGWANAGNTPWRLYKHFSHEGGIRTPLIVHWPAGLKARDEFRAQPGHVIDLMPTLVAVGGATYPVERHGVMMQPMEGRSLLPALQNQPIQRNAPLFFEHEGSRAVRDGKWKLVSLSGDAWELYDLQADPTEMRNLATTMPEQARALAAQWEAWAKRCHVEVRSDSLHPVSPGQSSAGTPKTAPATPQIANRPLRIRCHVHPESRAGVMLAQGGRQHGYALHLEDGRPVFSVRIAGQLFTVTAPEAPAGRCSLEATLEKDGTMRLAINGRTAATGKASGLIPTQPQDELSIGEDTRTAVGNYTAPNPLAGKVENVTVLTE
jgi:arylsulfatase A-like enzyme